MMRHITLNIIHFIIVVISNKIAKYCKDNKNKLFCKEDRVIVGREK